MDSTDVQSASLRSPWLASLSSGSTSVSVSSSAAGLVHSGQLSPISSAHGADLPCGATDSSVSSSPPSQSPPTTASAHSVSSSASAVPQPWHLSYAISGHASARPGPFDSYGIHHDVVWEKGTGEMVTKVEPLDDDDFCMDNLQEAPSSTMPSTSVQSSSQGAPDQPKPKRPRGRPRKHPLIPNASSNKVTKGRSKTGCLTCRKRKKKCDEAKPRCMNCEKNAVVCEGYPEKQIWKSGKERAEEERLKSRGFPSITMHPLFHGLETVEDRIFWKHYNEHLSTVLTVEGEHKNAFKDMLVPIAVKHQGLMHSILSLASKHIDFETPYGINLLRNNPATTLEALRERSLFHHVQARLDFYGGVQSPEAKIITEDKALLSARYAQILCFLLEVLAEGDSQGEHRLLLTIYRNTVTASPPENPAFLSFISEVFEYHIIADELIHSACGHKYSPLKPLAQLPAIHPPRLLGIADGLLPYLSQITAIRNTIRSKMTARIDPVVDYEDLYPAADIDAAIRDWAPRWPPGDSRDRVSLLYKQMMWIYLDRTVYPPSSSPPSPIASSAASLSLVHSSPSLNRPASSVVNTPPLSASTSCASSPRFPSCSPEITRANPRSDAPSRPLAHAGNHDASNRVDSPPPFRQPQHLDPRVTIAVDESLALLESFKPSDSCQTLLLLPCFLVGTACISPAQQRRVRAAIRTVKGYTGLRNTEVVIQLLEEVWRLMGNGEWIAAWDWPGVADRLGLDFIPA
ncbi:uncharacterized protein B0T15DRAFT_396330 [Chaetomium strumarium]|uniref:Zn(2)-C6 fungal-type domain-containing protein n=1 Tax=Chaetomium strumarium TaxID=1170767 RepID=A0AAJ0GTI9_9PEZI|nr:hypothetical protein B0T15DRAFT_396330 [Chaetomium strumarium]